MAAFLSLLSGSAKYEPFPRISHVSQSLSSKVVVQGGLTKDFSEKTKQRLTSVVEILDPYSELWEQRKVEGNAPSPGTYDSASTSMNDDLYTFGGYKDGNLFNTLHKLDSKTWRWCQLSPQNAEGAPMPKLGCGMTSFKDSLVVFGGYGIPRGPEEPGSFMKNTSFTDGTGWTNELHIYHLKEGVWSCPATTGDRPPPCAAFTFTAVDDRRAVMFGGKNINQGRMSNTYIIDFNTMHWVQLKQSDGGPWPEERAAHAACCLNYGQMYPQLLVHGGKNRQEEPLSDVWILDVERRNWKKVDATLKLRWWHSLTSFSLGPGLTEVTVFGGTAEPLTASDDKQPKIADTTLLQFRSSGQSEWELISVVDNSKRGSLERIVEKLRCLAQCVQQAAGQTDRADVDIRQQEQVDELQHRLDQALREGDRAVVEKRERDRIWVEKQEVERERDRVRLELQQAQEKSNELQRRLDEMERKECEKAVVQEQAIAAERRGPSWEVKEDELEVTEQRIGSGGWAEVRVAKLKVAAKVLHEQLVYDYHRKLFRREMDIAARVSHPNLLHFLGARLEGGMAILTELMPTTLRALVTRGPGHHLPLQHILSIAIDVACALNYLHHMTPDPIIHRDLSSANILLQPTPNGGWLAKVSDYGTAYFQSQLQTENPGSPVYTAPESHNPALQTPKMDIFSFGVVLVEMCTCQFPVREHRAELIESIEYPQLIELITRCLNVDKDRRPTAAQLVDILQSMQ